MDEHTKLCLHCNGAQGAVTIPDSSPAAHGNAIIHETAHLDQTWKKFGSASLKLDGDSDYISFPDHDDWHIGIGDFTLHLWIRWNAIGVLDGIFQQLINDANYFRLRWIVNNKIYLQSIINNVWKVEATCEFAPVINTDYHIAITRANGVLYMFINGISKAVTITQGAANANFGNLAADIDIGKSTEGPYYFNGWIDEYIFFNGLALWTANFTPPTEEYNGAPEKASYRAKKGLISGYHCFIQQYIYFSNHAIAPLKLPDGTLW